MAHSNQEINVLLEGIPDKKVACSRHYSQDEDFFLRLDDEYSVPHFPIHHDVRVSEPNQEYIKKLKDVLARIATLAPQVLKDTVYFFDPAEIFRPCFFKIFRLDGDYYLYLMRMDLTMKPQAAIIIERGTNDMSASFRSKRLFVEALMIPLADVVRVDGRVKSFTVKQTISQTWIGEQGRGYFVQGIWMDMDLTKFFSKLFLPAGAKNYPFYPYQCKYKTICHAVLDLTPEGRKNAVPNIHRAVRFLAPIMERIQASMKNGGFTEDMPVFRELKPKVPEAWYETWKDMRIEPYLNEADMREFRVEV